MAAAITLVLLQIDRFYRPGPSPGPYIALMILGFAVGIVGHIVRSRVIVGVGIAMIFLGTVLLPLQHAGDFID